MQTLRYWLVVQILLFVAFSIEAPLAVAQYQNPHIRVGAEQLADYLPLLRGRNVAVVGNHTSLVCGKHLVDTLLSLGITVKKIFCPEHGFRGDVEAGKFIQNQVDDKTGIPLVSIYGKNKKPTPQNLRGIDIIIVDLQDVGVRFYTYISTLHYVMEACAENKVQVVVLDRPNPNGFFVDGPVLDTAYRSFVGLHPVPLVYGMTIGEYAQMINGERWLKNGVQCGLRVIRCRGYNHSITYAPPVKPSPNLPNLTSILLYPSLGLFEGTVVSVGRGTDSPFLVFGYPEFPLKNFHFTPAEMLGASLNPPYKDELCFGLDLRDYSVGFFLEDRRVNLDWLIFAYRSYAGDEPFFNKFFHNLAGSNLLRKQIENGLSADRIREAWKPGVEAFMKVRAKYLLYDDFE